jgi:hypothetical protein
MDVMHHHVFPESTQPTYVVPEIPLEDYPGSRSSNKIILSYVSLRRFSEGGGPHQVWGDSWTLEVTNSFYILIIKVLPFSISLSISIFPFSSFSTICFTLDKPIPVPPELLFVV